MELATIEQSTLAECEAIIDRGRDTFIEVGNALLRIREERLYRGEFGTFQEYCEERWQMSRMHAHRLIDAAEVAGNLSPIGYTPRSESQLRPLKSLPPRVQRKAWRKAVESSLNGQPTAKEVTAAVEVVAPPPLGNLERINSTPSSGMQYAEMAIASLEKIQPNDTERDEGLNKVLIWIAHNKTRKA